MITKDDKEDNRFEIKIRGSGTEAEIIEALEALVRKYYTLPVAMIPVYENKTIHAEIAQIQD